MGDLDVRICRVAGYLKSGLPDGFCPSGLSEGVTFDPYIWEKIADFDNGT